jgi:ergothioneine biosynthesis protein EgtB
MLQAILILSDRFSAVRGMTRRLCETLVAEDCCIQSMPDVSPIRWHLAHTTWFFETFVLAAHSTYKQRHPQYAYLFNSYYNTVGEQFPRGERGLLSRPTVAEVWEYRQEIDEEVAALIERLRDDQLEPVTKVIELGLQHEQQHQELMLTDIKHVFSKNPLNPVFRPSSFPLGKQTIRQRQWIDYAEGVYPIGHEGSEFAYDNESPRHRVFLEPYSLADGLVTAGEYLEFMSAGGYERPEFWLSEGWAVAKEARWNSPMYWRHVNGQWMEFTLAGQQPLDLTRPVCHVSYFEADAFARWCGARLATEAEWEVAAEQLDEQQVPAGLVDVLLADGVAIHPTSAATVSNDPTQMLGDVWEWTSSSYAPYSGYQPPAGALGEYNGKFMCNQYVLRGGSCATSSDHIRNTYRNFFPTSARWQFSGIRLAKS